MRKEQGRARGGAPIGAIVLIILGVVLLLNTTGMVPWGVWGDVWRFWPIILVLIGLNLLLGGRVPWQVVLLVVGVLGAVGLAASVLAGKQEPVASSLIEPLGAVKGADVRITFGAGDLALGPLSAQSSNLVEATFRTPGQPATTSLRRSQDTADLRMTMEGVRWFSRRSNAQWDIFLSRNPKLSLAVDGGAAKMLLDLRDLQVSSLDLKVGAADVELTVPAHGGDVHAQVDGGAANIKVTIPEGTAAKIRRESGLSSFTIDSRFPRIGDFYVSPGFESARDRVTIEFRVGAASVTVR